MAFEIAALEPQPAGHPRQPVALNQRDRLNPERFRNPVPGALLLAPVLEMLGDRF
ncbi:hypothetical protein U5801_28325 [Lamprobacter modestohalophilus]|uniref:hypothetical protein n=1 Tax=Lamprobacter modestohalophilus TaxID=1064514 RepID=UPI002ADEAA9C|nr:hypothetical protein [Lamprobacter modestohalophilus]MEA1053684.1 hypothetical protein [Lamprobacter modestohalophilus]